MIKKTNGQPAKAKAMKTKGPSKKSNKKTKVFLFVAIIAITILPLYCVFSGTGPSEKEKAEIIETGVPGKAYLLSVERTGTRVNSVHQYKFTFRIACENGESFEMSRKKLVDPIYMGSIQIGMEIPVYVSPEKEVVILWEKVGIGEAF